MKALFFILFSFLATSSANAGEEQIELSWKQTFSPTILESRVPQKFLDIIKLYNIMIIWIRR